MSPGKNNAPSQLWQSLVTDGHVLAARARVVTPYLFVLGLLLFAYGAYGLLFVKTESFLPDEKPLISEKKDQYVSHVVKKIQSFVDIKTFSKAELDTLPPSDEIQAVIALLENTLNREIPYPKELASAIQSVTMDEFWKGDWPPSKIVVMEKEGIKAFGALVRVRNEETPKRWIGIFRKSGEKWVIGSIDSRGFVAPAKYPRVTPQEIPATLTALSN